LLYPAELPDHSFYSGCKNTAFIRIKKILFEMNVIYNIP